ncbi:MULTISPECIES: hypothetical protein [unclassified Synechococcus]|uniref:hypothetical protein n=1 Tax=unclassified Synechococcus TaxID=2626047 RepID=UPI0014089E71|nr:MULTISPECIES: hypothetical protein [unclassified Synechococcus]MCB4378827.1 hypothetical protein [Synechococcus sp. MU1650]MCB4393365.1 hypothetical protein [Synechococcus sp. PH41509]MCB4411122.1 hypothetical protein [Synechococcus sp. MU1611]MCB4423686.1 hypothetical protein [Synechococcus sp. HB1133]MCB4430605.1 hypothetical protein [Synechococcus sp. HBA1120]
MSAPSEPAWKRWLDRLLMVNVLFVFVGAGVFAVAVVGQSQGDDWLMDRVQVLWQPLFAPAISLLIMAALVSGIFSWWQRRVLKSDRGNGS